MARKTAEVTMDKPDRDHGKVFILTEMSAAQAERWGIRASGVMARAGLDVPDGGGMLAFAAMGFRAFLAGPFEETEPLLKEVMDCVTIKTEVMPQGRALVEEDIEEVATRLRLRDEVFELHVGFSLASVLSILGGAADKTEETSETTPTSPPQ